jgi:hypothetical protein
MGLRRFETWMTGTNPVTGLSQFRKLCGRPIQPEPDGCDIVPVATRTAFAPSPGELFIGPAATPLKLI